MILNVGSGTKVMQDAINMDIVKCEGVDVVWDFNKYPFPFQDNYFDEIHIPHSIQCVSNLILFMQEVHRIAKPRAKIHISCAYFLSPINCQDPYERTKIGFNTFDMFELAQRGRGLAYDTTAKFKILKREWIFSSNKKLAWLSFFPNLCPRFYARFLYFLFPSNYIYFKLRCVK